MAKQPVQIAFGHEDWSNMGVTPWMNYKINLPKRPLPAVADRGEMRTARLVVRPIAPSDLEAFWALRRIEELQVHSPSRGRADRDVDETRQYIERLQAPNDDRHWYWGAFLAATGEMVGECGIPDIEDQPSSGWSRLEILVRPDCWRQGYGTELYRAVMDSWWALPREPRRHQLFPVVAGDREPGQSVTECIEFAWESTNDVANKFFSKMLGHAPVSHEGYYEEFDRREGREGNLVRWCGADAVNPNS